jgi:hypothetical protein
MADNHALEQLLQMVEPHQPIRWHLVAQPVMEMLAAHQQANMFPVAVVVLVDWATELLVESVLIQIFLAQLLCMAVVVLGQVAIQDLHPQVEEVMTIRHQQTEVVVDHNQLEVAV